MSGVTMMLKVAVLVWLAMSPVSAIEEEQGLVTGTVVGELAVGVQPPATFKVDHLVSRGWQRDENGEAYEALKVKVAGVNVDAEVYGGNVWRIWVDEPGLVT